MSGATGRIASFDGVEIECEVHGTGSPALVFVHGWTCNRRHWDRQIDAFSGRHQVVLVDLGGHGASGTGRTAWTMQAFGRDVLAVVEHLDLEAVILVGHSMGGPVIVEAATLMPDRVVGLVGVDTLRSFVNNATPDEIEAGMPAPDAFQDELRTWLSGVFPEGSDPDLRQRIWDDMSAVPLDFAIDVLRELRSHRNQGEMLLELNKPAISISRGDASTSNEAAQRHGVEVVAQPGVGHWGMLEDPEGFNALLDKAIRQMMAADR